MIIVLRILFIGLIMRPYYDTYEDHIHVICLEVEKHLEILTNIQSINFIVKELIFLTNNP